MVPQFPLVLPQEQLRDGYIRLMQTGGAPVKQELGSALLEEGSMRDERLSIARVKNGFVKREGYRDIKVSLVFLSVQGFAMIGEVALVLESLVRYKDATHELYEIAREGDFFREVSVAVQADREQRKS